MLLMRWGGEAKGPWSASREGVSARLVSPRFLWRANEDVRLAVRLRNRSSVTRDVPELTVSLRVRLAGRIVSEETARLSAGVLPAGGELDLPLAHAPLGSEGPGLRAIDATLDGIALPALKLRMLKPR